MNYKTILLSTLSFIVSFANAQTETFDVLAFSPPVGYERQQGKAGVQFSRSTDSQTKYCNITVYTSRPGTDNIKQEFIDEWTILIKNPRNVDVPSETQTAPPEDGWSAIDGVAAIRSDKGNYAISQVTIVGHKRVTSILIITNSDYFNDDIEKFLESIKPQTKIAEELSLATLHRQGDHPNITITPPVTSNGAGSKSIAGVWWSFGTTSTTGGVTNAAGTGYASYGISSSSSVKRIAFLEDGTFCQILPDGGLFDYQQQRAKNPNYWGTYHFENGNGTLKLDGLSTTYSFTLQNDKIIYDRWEYQKIERVDHYLLQGTFTAEKNPSAYTGAEPTIDFSSDGRFADHGAIYWTRHVKSYTEDMQDKMTGSGKYEVLNYTITFSYDDGRLIRMTFLEAPPNPTQIRLGLSLLDRK